MVSLLPPRIKTLSIEQRLAALKIHAPGLPHSIITALRGPNAPAAGRNGENVTQKIDILQKQEHTAPSHKI
jgi:hypothetical protein